MKRIQCTKCKQVFWVELQLDEALVETGEWIQIPCPRCGSEWAMVQSAKRAPKRARPPARRKQVAAPPEEKPTPLPPARILSLRKKLGLSQAELGSLVEADRGSVLSWEKGKFKPKAEKAAQLAELAKKAKGEVAKLLEQKRTERGTNGGLKQPPRRRTVSRKKAAKAPKK